MTHKHVDAWLRTVDDIGARGTGAKITHRIARCWDGCSQPIVRVLDTPTTRTLTVSWCDASTGHYGYQTWRVRCARTAGTCVLTGRPIEAGDPVFSPRNGSPPPGNAGAMIAAASLRCASKE
ncbi:hypothetical protein AWB80_05513 [Caballeronia pedi]|uniref:Ribosomal protein S14 n=1 Tax=Caballeronia pedi TaxID=1777141 RepID=A0A158CMK0_9BURK|nr:DUF3331 domain-containing protein [Caballeronia pedi]SAK83585.1 hypothetical protein AWB80_05513 [Caballeronia pedi]